MSRTEFKKLIICYVNGTRDVFLNTDMETFDNHSIIIEKDGVKTIMFKSNIKKLLIYN